MIVDAEGRPVTPDVAEEHAAVRPFVAAFADHDAAFVWDPEREGVDLRAGNAGVHGPNRARVKLFMPRRGSVVLFAYKDSQVPFSTDRFAYGALIVKGDAFPETDVEALIAYMVAGLHPEERPPALKRAFPFTIPH